MLHFFLHFSWSKGSLLGRYSSNQGRIQGNQAIGLQRKISSVFLLSPGFVSHTFYKNL